MIMITRKFLSIADFLPSPGARLAGNAGGPVTGIDSVSNSVGEIFRIGTKTVIAV